MTPGFLPLSTCVAGPQKLMEQGEKFGLSQERPLSMIIRGRWLNADPARSSAASCIHCQAVRPYIPEAASEEFGIPRPPGASPASGEEERTYVGRDVSIEHARACAGASRIMAEAAFQAFSQEVFADGRLPAKFKAERHAITGG